MAPGAPARRPAAPAAGNSSSRHRAPPARAARAERRQRDDVPRRRDVRRRCSPSTTPRSARWRVYPPTSRIGYQAPTWGAHGGPLWFVEDATGGGVTLERWTPPAGATGALTKQETHVDTKIPTGAFAGARGGGPALLRLDGAGVDGRGARYHGDDRDDQGRRGRPAPTPSTAPTRRRAGHGDSGSAPHHGALDDRRGDADAERLLRRRRVRHAACPTSAWATGCSAPAAIAAWGDASGPVAVDHAGNAFVVHVVVRHGHAGGARLRPAPGSPGCCGAEGVKLFTMPGFGDEPRGPRAERPRRRGCVAYQPATG